MATTTFSGPIKAGTISNTTGTTVGTNMKNTGQVVMAQSFAASLAGGRSEERRVGKECRSRWSPYH